MRVLTYFAVFLVLACNSSYKISQSDSALTSLSNIESSEAIDLIIAPYKEKLENEMSEVLLVLPESIKKGKPQSKLTNLIADGLMHQVKKECAHPIDFSIVNYGGIRIPELYAGEISKGLIYELLPFDNFLVVLELDYDKLSQLFNIMAKNGGWPISENVKYTIDKNTLEAKSVQINGKPIQKNETFNVLIPDYVANGGDSCFFLKEVNQKTCKLYLRDAMINYLKDNNTINLKSDDRVSYDE